MTNGHSNQFLKRIRPTSERLLDEGFRRLAGVMAAMVAIVLFAILIVVFTGAIEAMANLENAETTITNSRARVGALQNRLTRAIQNLGVNIENLTAAASTIRDLDIAEEVTDLTKQLLLVQSSAAMVGQANLKTEGVLSLLR